ncbi:MAG TPA: hypothetical protein VIM92_05135 [Rhodanobacteraceae bacterium]
MQEVTYSNPPQDARLPVGPALTFAVFGAPAAWALQLGVNYALSAHACYPMDIPLLTPVWGPLWWILIGIDMAAIIVSGGSFLVALGQWRRWRGASLRHVGERRNRHIAQWAVLTSALFSLAVIFTIVMLFIEPVCND